MKAHNLLEIESVSDGSGNASPAQESHAILKGGKIQGRYPGSPGWYGGKVANLIDENIPIKIWYMFIIFSSFCSTEICKIKSHPSTQSSIGHSPSSSQQASMEGTFSRRFSIISFTSEGLTLKTSARISLAASNSIAFRSEWCTVFFCGQLNRSRIPAIIETYCVQG